MKNILCGALAIAITGCASTSKSTGPWVASTSESTGPWVVVVKNDPLSGEVECFATTGNFITEPSDKYFPIILNKNGVLMVGARSGGLFPSFAGDIKIRVDSNKVYDIDSHETPENKKMDPVYVSMLQRYERLSEGEKKLVTNAVFLAEYTVAMGDKAKALLEEIKHGRKLIYEAGIFASYPGTSSIGEVEINGSLFNALKHCGIE